GTGSAERTGPKSARAQKVFQGSAQGGRIQSDEEDLVAAALAALQPHRLAAATQGRSQEIPDRFVGGTVHGRRLDAQPQFAPLHSLDAGARGLGDDLYPQQATS